MHAHTRTHTRTHARTHAPDAGFVGLVVEGQVGGQYHPQHLEVEPEELGVGTRTYYPMQCTIQKIRIILHALSRQMCHSILLR